MVKLVRRGGKGGGSGDESRSRAALLRAAAWSATTCSVVKTGIEGCAELEGCEYEDVEGCDVDDDGIEVFCVDSLSEDVEGIEIGSGTGVGSENDSDVDIDDTISSTGAASEIDVESEIGVGMDSVVETLCCDVTGSDTCCVYSTALLVEGAAAATGSGAGGGGGGGGTNCCAAVIKASAREPNGASKELKTKVPPRDCNSLTFNERPSISETINLCACNSFTLNLATSSNSNLN